MMASKQKNVVDLILNGPIVNKATKSFTFSRSFTKVMLMCSFVNIAYSRLNINKSEVRKRKFQEIPFMGLSRKIPDDPRLKLFLNQRSGVFEAIDKNHLKEVYLLFTDKDEVVESYIFKIRYNLNHDSKTESNTVQHKDALVALLELFLELGQQNKLSNNIKIEMELAYYDNTPKKYEPPGFEASTNPYCLRIDSIHHKLANINTGFHCLKLYGIGEVFNKMYSGSGTRSVVAAISNEQRGDLIESESQDEGYPNPKKARLEIVADANKDGESQNEVQPGTEKSQMTVDTNVQNFSQDSISTMNLYSQDIVPATNIIATKIQTNVQNCSQDSVSTMNLYSRDIVSATDEFTSESPKKKIDSSNIENNTQNYSQDVIFVTDDFISKNPRRNESPKIRILGNVEIEREPVQLDCVTISDGPINSTIISEDESDNQSVEMNCKCICGIDKVPGYVGTIACSVCSKVFHKPCHGFIVPDSIKEEKFRCNDCDTNDNLLKSIQRAEHSLIGKIRLLIYVLYKTKKLNFAILNEIPEDVKNGIMERFYSFNIYTIDEATQKELYDPVAMERVLKTLFPDEDESQYLIW